MYIRTWACCMYEVNIYKKRRNNRAETSLQHDSQIGNLWPAPHRAKLRVAKSKSKFICSALMCCICKCQLAIDQQTDICVYKPYAYDRSLLTQQTDSSTKTHRRDLCVSFEYHATVTTCC